MMAIALVHSLPHDQGNDADNCNNGERIQCKIGYNEDRIDFIGIPEQCRPITCRSQTDLFDTYKISAIGRPCRLSDLVSNCDFQ
jgi:hypothetical protein